MSTEKAKRLMTDDELAWIGARFRLLGEPMRLRILQVVCERPRSVNEIVAATGSTQANVSKHLALLATSGILRREKEGQCVFYGIQDRMVLQLCKLVYAQMEGKAG